MPLFFFRPGGGPGGVSRNEDGLDFPCGGRLSGDAPSRQGHGAGTAQAWVEPWGHAFEIENASGQLLQAASHAVRTPAGKRTGSAGTASSLANWKARMGSRTEILCAFRTPGSIRIAAFELGSQKC